MRSTKERRQPHATSLFPFDDNKQGQQDRRQTAERRMENMTMEERLLLLAEMPSYKPNGSKD